jgi:hypothetical protein
LPRKNEGDIMITVSILINGQPIFTRSAHNKGDTNAEGCHRYVTDAGETIYHDRDDGAIELAKLMLDTIDEKMGASNKGQGENVTKREELAALCHEQWSGWMIYIFKIVNLFGNNPLTTSKS